MFYDFLERKNSFLTYKNKKLKKSKSRDFSKGVSPWFWSKIGHICKVLFYFIKSQVFDYFNFLFSFVRKLFFCSTIS